MMNVVGGAQTYSKARDRYPLGVPKFAASANGAYMWTPEGRRLIDTVNALGTVVLGHRNRAVLDAVENQLAKGVAFSVATDLEQRVAEQIGQIVPYNMDAVRFAKNGADVTGAAVRLARALMGSDYIVMSETGYHGHHDWCMTRPPKNKGVPHCMRARTRFYKHGDLDSLQKAIEGGALPAAVVVEPVESGNPVIPPGQWWQGMRDLCDHYGCMLIFDEVVTGLRVPHFTYARWMMDTYDVGPDLLCLGKGIANGFPLSALVGPSYDMEAFTEDVFFSTTHGGEALSLAAAEATIAEARRRYLPDVLASAGRRYKEAFARAAAQCGVATGTYGYDARPVFRFGSEGFGRRFGETMMERDVLWQGYVNFSYDLADPRVLAVLEEKTQLAFERTEVPDEIPAS